MANDQELEFYEHAAFPDELDNLLEQDYQLNDEDHNSDENLVLIADDCSFNIVAVQSLLLQFNLKSDVCVNGLEAVKLVKNRLKAEPQKPMYKLILMDFSMPKCDGPEATKQIRQYPLKKNCQKQCQGAKRLQWRAFVTLSPPVVVIFTSESLDPLIFADFYAYAILRALSYLSKRMLALMTWIPQKST